MRKKLFFVFFIGIFIACSPDQTDDVFEQPIDTSQNEPGENVGEEASVRLLKVIQNRYNGATLNQKIEFIYRDNKLAIDSFYNNSQQLSFVQKWIYDENGLLSATEGYLPDGTLTQKNTYEFDDLGRLSNRNSSEEEGTYLTNVSFTYNNDNTITGTSNSESGVVEKIFYLNENGQIYKEENRNSVVEVTYDGEKVLSLDFNGNRTDFIYDNVNLPLGPFKNPWDNILGSNKNNIVLWGFSLWDQASGLDGRFLLESQFEGGGVIKNEYVFNDAGYPVSRKQFSNDELISEFVYIYE